MKYYALIGNPVKHSLSPGIHNLIFKVLKKDFQYLAFSIQPHTLREAVLGMKALGFLGFNVTHPFKIMIMKYLDKISDEAQRIGAVNTVKINGEELSGFNTDGIGFIRALNYRGIHIEDKNIMILGAGGAARSILFSIFIRKPKTIYILNRSQEKAFSLKKELEEVSGISCIADSIYNVRNYLSEVDLLVNATSMGMTSDNDFFRYLNLNNLKKDAIIYDILYNTPRNSLFHVAKDFGITSYDGKDMLVFQAIEAQKIWGNLDDNLEKCIIKELKKEGFF